MVPPPAPSPSGPRLLPRRLALAGLAAAGAVHELLAAWAPGGTASPAAAATLVAAGLIAAAAFVRLPPAARACAPRRLVLGALGLALLAPPLAARREAALRPPVELAASVSRVSLAQPPPEPAVIVNLRSLARRAPLWRLVGRSRDVRLEATGYLAAPRAGRYRFTLRADDTATVRIGATTLFEQSPGGEAVIELAAGVHPLLLRLEQTEGAAFLELDWQPPGGPLLLDLLSHVAERPERVTPAALRRARLRASGALLAGWICWLAAAWLLVRAAESRETLRAALRDALRRATAPRVAPFSAGALFLLSGVAALVYQVAWQRILALASGIGVYSVALIVAAFMAGLGFGSEIGGRLSARLAPRRALAGFALLELSIAAFALASPLLFYDLLYVRASALYRSLWSAGLAHFLALLPPTLLMGMSLPFLVRALVRDAAGASRTIGYLYGINVVGAALGALVAPWLLIRHFGLPGAITAGAACNALAGLGALALGRALAAREEAPEAGVPAAGSATASPAGPAPPPPSALPARDAGEAAGSRPFPLWLGLYALSGFCALSLEILWFRVVDVTVKSSAFTFGTVLALYLGGLALGSLAGTRWLDRVRRPLLVFLTCQALLLGYAGASAALLVRLPPELPVYDWFHEYWGGYGGLVLGRQWFAGPLLRLYLLLPLLLFFPSTLLMGLSFPILQKAVHDEPARAGRRVGALQAANIAGCVAGSLLVGLVSLRLLGTTGTLRALMACGLGFAALGLWLYGRRPLLLAGAAALAAVLVLLPGQTPFWARLHARGPETALVEEDASAVVALTAEGERRWRVSVNGQGHSYLPYGGAHSLLGALPVLVHPAPQRVAIIGLGSGDTAWAAGCRPETRELRVFEIATPQRPLLERIAEREDYPGLRRLLDDPRLRLVLEDGRHALYSSAEAFDVIQTDPLEPHKAMSGNLNSVEFYRLVAARLGPRGVFCAWVPRPRIRNAFRAAFPHVLAARGDTIYLGSNEPLLLQRRAWAQRLDAVRDYLGPEIARRIEETLADLEPVEAGSEPGDPNEDLHPREEFLSP